MEKEFFKEVINDGEEIQAVFKPVKKPYLMKFAIPFFSLIIPALILTICVIFINTAFLYFIFVIVVLYVMALYELIVKIYNYKNTYYCITNKRLIIRDGVFGIDFRSVDLKDVEVIDVYVGFFDKCCGNKSGTIVIGTYGRPLVNGLASFCFLNVDNAYSLCTNLKKMVEIAKSGEKVKKIENKVAKENVKEDLSTEEKLLKIKKLKQQGIIDEEVYEETINKIIDKL